MDDYILKAKFSEDHSKALFSALKDLQRVQCDRFAINFTTDKKIKISTQTESKAIATMLAFGSDFIPEMDIKKDLDFAVMNVNEMVSILNVFSSGFEMNIDSTTMKLSTEETELVYYAGNLKLVRTGPKALEKELPYLQKVEFNSDKYKSFVKALPVLDHGYVIFKGVNGQSELQISITDKDIRSNSFTQKVKCDQLKDTFKVVVNKQSLIAILGSNNFDSLNLGICKDMIHIDGVNSAYKASFFLRTVV